jgi:hypothetical protein
MQLRAQCGEALMIKSELVARIAEQNPHLYERDVEAIINPILDTKSTRWRVAVGSSCTDSGCSRSRKREVRMRCSQRSGIGPLAARCRRRAIAALSALGRMPASNHFMG